MDFDTIRESVIPWIKVAVPDSSPDSPDDESVSGELVTRDFMGDLVITFAVDDGDYLTLLQRKDIPEGMGDDELFMFAKRNLAELVEFDLSGTSYGGYGILAGGDHEADALCLEFIWDAVAKQAGEDLVVAVPSRDCLFMAAKSDPEQVSAMGAIARDIFTQGEEALTRTLFLFHADTRDFSVYGTL